MKIAQGDILTFNTNFNIQRPPNDMNQTLAPTDSNSNEASGKWRQVIEFSIDNVGYNFLSSYFVSAIGLTKTEL